MDITKQASEIIKFYVKNKYSSITIYNYQLKLNRIIKDAAELEDSSLTSVIKILKEKYTKERNDSVISNNTYKILRRELLLLEKITQRNDLSWQVFPNKKSSGLSVYYDEKLSNYKHAHPKSKEDLFMIKAFFMHLQKSNVNTFVDANTDHVTSFIKIASEKYSNRSMEKIRSSFRKARQLYGEDFVPSFSFAPIYFARKRSSRKKYKPFEKSDIVQLLESIDTNNEVGLRDFAIISLGACLGLRACDIVNLKLSDFNWKERKVNFVQQKTGKSLTLPLNDLIYYAVASYILKGRPNSESKFIFLRSLAPYDHFCDGTSIGCILRKRMKNAGIIHNIGDGITFHGLRRFFATEIVKNKYPIGVATELLGHSTFFTLKQYVGYDIETLRKISLDLTSIEGIQE